MLGLPLRFWVALVQKYFALARGIGEIAAPRGHVLMSELFPPLRWMQSDPLIHVWLLRPLFSGHLGVCVCVQTWPTILMDWPNTSPLNIGSLPQFSRHAVDHTLGSWFTEWLRSFPARSERMEPKIHGPPPIPRLPKVNRSMVQVMLVSPLASRPFTRLNAPNLAEFPNLISHNFCRTKFGNESLKFHL